LQQGFPPVTAPTALGVAGTPSVGTSPASASLSPQQLQRATEIIRSALEKSAYRWRSVETLASIAAIPESLVLDILRSDPDVRLSCGKSARQIAGLKARVGE